MPPIDLDKYFLPYQRRWINTPGALVIGEKSRRIGWTYAESARAVIRRLEKGTDLFYSSADMTSAREFVEDCQIWARVAKVVAEDLGQIVIDEQDGIAAFVLRFANGAKIMAGSSSPKFFRGKGGDADADEFAFHNQPRELYKAMHATALVWGHEMRLWSTHNGEGSYFNGLVKEGKQSMAAGPDYRGLRAEVQTVTIYDAVEQGLVERIKKLPARDDDARRNWLEELKRTIPDEDTWNEEYVCRPSSEQSSLISYGLIQGCEVANLRLAKEIERLPAGQLYAGFDVGRKRDLSVLWVLERLGDVFWTRMVRVLDQVNFTAQEELLSLLLRNRWVKRLCIDSTGIGAMLAERLTQRWGSRAEGLHFSAPVKSELAMPLLRLFQDKLVRVPADAAVREDLHKIRKIVTAANNVRLDADRDEAGHADRFWALALAYHAADDARGRLPAPLLRKPVGW